MVRGKDSKFWLVWFSLVVIGGLVAATGPYTFDDVFSVPVDSNGAVPVNIQDQTTRPIDIEVYQVVSSAMNLSQPTVAGNYDVVLTTSHGVVVGDFLFISEQNGSPLLWYGKVLAVSTNTITLDSPSPNNFSIAATVFEYINEVSVNGAVTTQVFKIENYFTGSIDITRLIWHCTDTKAMDDGLFCGESALARGIVLRKNNNDGTFINYWNIKTNGDWGHLAYDKSYDTKAPTGVYGFSSRLTYAGQSKHGVTIRLDPGESIELLVQDDLTGIDEGRLMVEGHIVEN